MLTTGCFQLLFGRLYATFSTKWIFIIAISIFEFGSLICGATPSSIGLSKSPLALYLAPPTQLHDEANLLMIYSCRQSHRRHGRRRNHERRDIDPG